MTSGNETGLCASPEEIDNYVSKVKVETWISGFKLDFMIHGGGIPARKNVRWIKTDMLDPKIVKQNWLLTRKHIINTEDSFVQLGPLSIDWAYYDVAEAQEDSAFRNP